ncbi:MAG: ribonuclease H [Microscillaceae bacterium]|nr:ribonuclease H [Microscillaceae bacterium]
MAKKEKFYVVWQGRVPGLYLSWAECEAQVKGFAGATYKSFLNRAEAEAALHQTPPSFKRAASTGKTPSEQSPRPFLEALCVDAACSGNPGPMEYRGVDLQTGKEVFHRAYPLGTNNIGEFLAIVHGLALVVQAQVSYPLIFTDSRTALAWVKAKKCRTKLKASAKLATLFDHIQRAEKWLAEHNWATQLAKWETEKWGEIPADFGRK